MAWTRILLLVSLYLVLGLFGLGFVALVAVFSDPCAPSCAASGSGGAFFVTMVVAVVAYLGSLAWQLPRWGGEAGSAASVVLKAFVAVFVLMSIAAVIITRTMLAGATCDCG